MTAERLLEITALKVDLIINGSSRTVIHDVTLPIAAGESVGLVGESGSGKSMTARAVVGLLPPRARIQGDILFGGTSVPSLRGKELRNYRRTGIAIIHQNPRSHINPVRTIGSFMTEALIASGEPHDAAEERVVAALADVGIPDGTRRLRQYPHQLSGGLLQRVMIATAVVAQPRLLIADEPTSALDVTTQEEVMAIIDDLRREHGLAMLFISHDLELTAAVTDRIAVMYAGMLVEDAPTEMLHAPLHPYTAGLLAARPGVRESRRLWAIPGRPMSAFEVGRGCVFAARCPFVMEKCRAERPRRLPLAGHFVACHRAEELQGQLTYETMTRP